MELLAALRRLRIASMIEGVTLLLLLGIAVPLKHMAGMPAAVSLMGPVHGLAFLTYVWMAVNVASGANWPRRDIVRTLAAALVAFGGFFNVAFIRRQEREAVYGLPGSTGIHENLAQ